jgi:hypothetical protein
MLEKSRECFERVIICNLSKSSQVRVNIKFLITQIIKAKNSVRPYIELALMSPNTKLFYLRAMDLYVDNHLRLVILYH